MGDKVLVRLKKTELWPDWTMELLLQPEAKGPYYGELQVQVEVPVEIYNEWLDLTARREALFKKLVEEYWEAGQIDKGR
jgi:hypothetical protein